MSYPLINGTVINGASAGILLQVADGVAGVTFGVPKLKVGTDRAFTPSSLRPVRFGDAFLQAGMPPNSTMLGVASLRQVAFGKPAVSAVLVLRGLAPLQPVSFGHAVMRARLTAKGLAATTIGTPGQVAHFQPQPQRRLAKTHRLQTLRLNASRRAVDDRAVDQRVAHG